MIHEDNRGLYAYSEIDLRRVLFTFRARAHFFVRMLGQDLLIEVPCFQIYHARVWTGFRPWSPTEAHAAVSQASRQRRERPVNCVGVLRPFYRGPAGVGLDPVSPLE